MESPPPQTDADESTIKILISTDNHLGYNENDGIRGKDSFRAFEEMLALGVKNKVDFVLLAGDLFHHNKPSRATLYRTMSMLRNHCLGDGVINFQILSDQSLNFPNFGCVNYEDPNINVKLPVFSIHGNHDDPTGEAGRSLAALDLLSAANLVNYFGKSERVDEIEIFPILLEKGTTKLAIYGLGNMRDERLYRMFSQGNVRFRRPEESPEAWFSIFVVHQNRDNRGRGAKNCLPESFIPEFIDFVVWGHEHECLIEVEESIKGNFYITQPGSSVATSLVEGEAKPKKIGILEVQDQNFRLTSIPLKTVRPFKMTELSLRDYPHLDPNDAKVDAKISALLAQKVEELIQQAEEEYPNHANEPSMQVLVRIKVEHSGFPVLSNQRFGAQFVGRVANPGDILLFSRKKGDDETKSKAGSSVSGSLRDPIRPGPPTVAGVEQILLEHLSSSDRKLEIFPEANLANALEDFVFKNVLTAFGDVCDDVLKETRGVLKQHKSSMTKSDIKQLVEQNVERLKISQAVRASQNDMDTSQVMRMLQAPVNTGGSAFSEGEELMDSDLNEDEPPPSSSKRKAPARKKAAPKKKATPASRKKTSRVEYSDEEVSEAEEEVDSASDDEIVPPKRAPAKSRAAPKASTSRRKTKATDDGDTTQPATKRAKQTSVASFFSQSSQLPLTNGWREAPSQAQPPIVSQTPSGRRLPPSFSSFTQEDDPRPPSSAASTVAKGWGRARK